MTFRLPLWARLGFAAAIILSIFIPLASALFLTGTGLWGFYGPWWWAFPEYLLYGMDLPGAADWLLDSAATAGFLILFAGAVLYAHWGGWLAGNNRRMRFRNRSFWLGGPSPRRAPPRPSERGMTDNHGHSNWRSAADTEKLFPGPHPKWGGLAVGEVYRVDRNPSLAGIPFDSYDPKTWGQGGKARLLIDPCTDGSGHSLVFAGSGAFKTQSAVASILTWTGSSVVLDPSTELGPMLDGALKKQSKRVVHLGVAQDDDDRPPQTGFNVLSWIDTAHPEAELHVRSVVSWVYDSTSERRGPTPEHQFFGEMGRSLVTCVLAHILWSAPAQIPATLETFAAAFAISEKKMLSFLTSIFSDSKSRLARQLAGTLMDPGARETFSGIFLNAVRGVQWLFTRSYAAMVSQGDFDPESLLQEPTTVFLNISLRTLETTPALPRVMIGALLNTLYMADGKTDGKVLFLLDEAAQLGRLKTLETARDTGRKYGIVLHALWQSIGQMAEIWGREGTRAWIDAARWIGYAAIRAGGAGKDLSDQLGAHGVLAWSEGDNQGSQRPFGLSFGTTSRGATTNVHEIRRSLITAPELQQDLREDELIVVPGTGAPIRCGRALWFRREKMAAIIATNRFAKGAPNGGSNLDGKARPASLTGAAAGTGRRLDTGADNPRRGDPAAGVGAVAGE